MATQVCYRSNAELGRPLHIQDQRAETAQGVAKFFLRGPFFIRPGLFEFSFRALQLPEECRLGLLL